MTGTEGSPEETLERFRRTFSRLDLTGISECFADDATMFSPLPSYPERLSGASAIREQFAAIIANVRARGGSELPLKFEDVQMYVVGDVAIVTFHLRGTGLGRRTLVLAHSEGGWHVVHLHASAAASTG